jgi:hypothetical protein
MIAEGSAATFAREIRRPSEPANRRPGAGKEVRMRDVGRALFVAILLLNAGVLLNIIYGIAAVGNAHFFNGTVYAFPTLHTWGWITVIVGVNPARRGGPRS